MHTITIASNNNYEFNLSLSLIPKRSLLYTMHLHGSNAKLMLPFSKDVVLILEKYFEYAQDIFRNNPILKSQCFPEYEPKIFYENPLKLPPNIPPATFLHDKVVERADLDTLNYSMALLEDVTGEDSAVALVNAMQEKLENCLNILDRSYVKEEVEGPLPREHKAIYTDKFLQRLKTDTSLLVFLPKHRGKYYATNTFLKILLNYLGLYDLIPQQNFKVDFGIIKKRLRDRDKGKRHDKLVASIVHSTKKVMDKMVRWGKLVRKEYEFISMVDLKMLPLEELLSLTKTFVSLQKKYLYNLTSFRKKFDKKYYERSQRLCCYCKFFRNDDHLYFFWDVKVKDSEQVLCTDCGNVCLQYYYVEIIRGIENKNFDGKIQRNSHFYQLSQNNPQVLYMVQYLKEHYRKYGTEYQMILAKGDKLKEDLLYLVYSFPK